MDDYERPAMSTSIPMSATRVKTSQFKRHLEHLNTEIRSLEEKLDDLYWERGVVRDAIEKLEAHMKDLDEIQKDFNRFYSIQN